MKFAILTPSCPGNPPTLAFADIAEALRLGLIALGHDAIIVGELIEHYRPIFLGINWLVHVSWELPQDSILYNLEDIHHNPPWCVDPFLSVLQKYVLWDYRETNCIEWALLGCMHSIYVPLIYAQQQNNEILSPDAQLGGTPYSPYAVLENALNASQQKPSDLIRVDLGCGTSKFPGFIGVDVFSAPEVDIVADLSSQFPFADSSVDQVRAYDFIEHLPDRLHTMNEIWRICKDGALVNLLVPSTDGRGAFQDPTHVSFWNLNSFRYFTIESPWFLKLCQQYGFQGAFSLLSLRQYESSDQVVHVHALLRVVKEDILPRQELPQKSVYVIIFPDWQQQNEILLNEIKSVLLELSTHSDSQAIALLVDTSSVSEFSTQSPEATMLEVAMDLLLSEEVDVEAAGIELAFVQCFDPKTWAMIKPKLGYHLRLTQESLAAALLQDVVTVQTCDITDFRNETLSLRFGLSSPVRHWLKEQVQDSRIEIEDYSYATAKIDFHLYHADDRIYIGKFCSLAANVTIFGGEEVALEWATIYPFKKLFWGQEILEQNQDSEVKRPRETRIGHDVWIGQDVIILSGVTIGHGAVIDAGSVVTDDVEPYAVVAGNPARLIRYRFKPETIEFLLNLRWWDWPLSKILSNLDILSENPEQWTEESRVYLQQ